jgi:hypothetical protein
MSRFGEEMMRPFRLVWNAVFVACFLANVASGSADRIFLKDGTIVVSDKVWQTDAHVHFILQGTQGVEIRYAKEIVAKFETHGQTLKPIVSEKPRHDAAPRNQLKPGSDVNPPKGEPVEAATATGVPSPERTASIVNSTVASNHGLSFYDPRRDKRYWASRNSKHDTLDSALLALADMYGRTTQWVAAHMGDQNDLEQIHACLTQRKQAESTAEAKPKDPSKPAPRHFYTEGGKLPYSIGSGRSFKTRDAAIEALARQYHQSVEWVDQRITNQTDVDAIDQILNRSVAENDGTEGTSIRSDSPIDPGTLPPEGLLFYNPRRDQKYWTGKMTRFNTLKEALQALARQYGVTTDYIESYMGDTNDLSTIHRNIRKSLP